MSEFQNNSMNEKLVKAAESLVMTGEGEDELTQSIGSLLSLPEDQFMIMAPLVLNELNYQLNDPDKRLSMVFALNSQGVKVEDMVQALDELITAIDEHREEFELSNIKLEFIKELLSAGVNSLQNVEGIARRTMEVPIQLVDSRAKLPTYANMTDAGLDVYALEDITIAPGETKLVKTGFKIAVPLGYEMQVRPKSGRCLKTKLRVANTPGTIDSGYRDEVGVIIENVDPPIKKFIGMSEDGMPVFEYGSSYTIGAGEKFAQLVLKEQPKVTWREVENILDIEGNRGGGFGSSGLK